MPNVFNYTCRYNSRVGQQTFKGEEVKKNFINVRIDEEIRADLDYLKSLDINLSAMVRRLIQEKANELKTKEVK